ncbi:MAG TPA: methyltransferase domain-containing protein [Thiothrix sp.]|nr:methyltransferase domain-containing protein [Thiothrix sp.]
MQNTDTNIDTKTNDVDVDVLVDWEARYQAGTTGWDRGTSSANLQRWLDSGLLQPCSILIPGCGNGYEVIELAKAGFTVTAIDIAPTPVKQLKHAINTQLDDSQGLRVTVLQADFFTYQPTQTFDAIYEQTSLCALSPAQWQTYAHCLQQWLKPNGQLFAQFMQTGQTGGPPWHCPIDAMQPLFPSTHWHWQTQLPHLAMREHDPKFELPYLLVRR